MSVIDTRNKADRVESSWQFIWAARNFARKRNAAIPLECGKWEPHRTIANAQ